MLWVGSSVHHFQDQLHMSPSGCTIYQASRCILHQQQSLDYTQGQLHMQSITLVHQVAVYAEGQVAGGQNSVRLLLPSAVESAPPSAMLSMSASSHGMGAGRDTTMSFASGRKNNNIGLSSASHNTMLSFFLQITSPNLFPRPMKPLTELLCSHTPVQPIQECMQ